MRRLSGWATCLLAVHALLSCRVLPGASLHRRHCTCWDIDSMVQYRDRQGCGGAGHRLHHHAAGPHDDPVLHGRAGGWALIDMCGQLVLWLLARSSLPTPHPAVFQAAYETVINNAIAGEWAWVWPRCLQACPAAAAATLQMLDALEMLVCNATLSNSVSVWSAANCCNLGLPPATLRSPQQHRRDQRNSNGLRFDGWPAPAQPTPRCISTSRQLATS